jgi:lipopolysaccharide/colanic/teichoic acid biosynthesis glycosyltransferase
MDTGTSALTLSVPGIAPSVVAHPVTGAPSPAYPHVKRGVDVALSIVTLVLALPLLALVALLVRCSSPGPVLFRQSRIGRNGRSFTVLKFRSMCRDAEVRLRDLNLYDTYVATGYKLPVADEFRLTRIGRFLRRSSLDELPQLFNVLRGDMSLVGPRPVVPEELTSYGDLVHCYLGVRPGITGMWQVTGRSAVQYPERAHIDHQYFLRRSVRLDLAILARTPRAVLRGDGAY